MSLPLQPGLRPAPAWLRRLLALSVVAAAVLALGFLAPDRKHPPRLLVNDNRHADAFLPTLHALCAKAKERLWLVVFVMRPDGDGGLVDGAMQALIAAEQRGVDVRVVLDIGRNWHTGEIEPKHVDAAAQFVAGGVAVRLDELDRTTHIKGLLVDDSSLLIGSHNWTTSAFSRNREASILVRDGVLAAQFAALFEDLWAVAEEP